MKFDIEITEAELTKLVRDHLEELLNRDLEGLTITIEVKSTQNYKSEWEKAAFRARVSL